MSLKRINRELQILSKYFSENDLYYNFTNENNENYIIIFNKENNILKITFPKDYPFKPYYIHLIKKINTLQSNNICIPIEETFRYDKWLSNIKIIDDIYHSKFMNALLYNNISFKKLSCFCCLSVQCSNNWNPRLNIESGLKEYKKFLIYKLYSSPIMINYLKKLYNNLFPNLSIELKEHIFSFI